VYNVEKKNTCVLFFSDIFMGLGVIKNYASFVGDGGGGQDNSREDLIHGLENIKDYLKFAPE
jgi:hypothetical protein